MNVGIQIIHFMFYCCVTINFYRNMDLKSTIATCLRPYAMVGFQILQNLHESIQRVFKSDQISECCIGVF